MKILNYKSKRYLCSINKKLIISRSEGSCVIKNIEAESTLIMNETTAFLFDVMNDNEYVDEEFIINKLSGSYIHLPSERQMKAKIEGVIDKLINEGIILIEREI